MQQKRTFSQWLEYIESLNRAEIELGLHRIRTLVNALNKTSNARMITVTGTNGKGSTCAYLESILTAAGYRTGCYTSPHLIRFNERIRVSGEPADDALLTQSFERVDAARGDLPVTFFEFTTAVAWDIFSDAGLDVIIWEVGLGGKLDAVNVFDANCMIVTSLDIDHTNYLGETREAIALEKAGIFRGNCPAICADPNPPESFIQYANQINARLIRYNVDFFAAFEPIPITTEVVCDQNVSVQQEPLGTAFEQASEETEVSPGERQWTWRFDRPDGTSVIRHALPIPGIRGAVQLRNAAAALTALDCLREALPITLGDIRLGLSTACLTARLQQLSARPLVILDVSHNPEAVRILVNAVSALPPATKRIAVFGMLRDKAIDDVIQIMMPHIDEWHVTSLPSSRSESAENIAQKIRAAGGTVASISETPEQACRISSRNLTLDDRMIVFGSFVLAGCVLQLKDWLPALNTPSDTPAEKPITLINKNVYGKRTR